MSKTLASTYIYSKYSEVEKNILTFLMEGEEIDKGTDAFDSIDYAVKMRKLNSSLSKVLRSNNVVLMVGPKPMPRAFKVFCAKDIKGKRKDDRKVFIDCSDIIRKDGDIYVCSEIDVLVSYLVSAMHTAIYYADEKLYTTNNKVITTGSICFSSLVCSIVDYLCRINTMPDLKAKCTYLCTLYYISNVLGNDPYSSTSINLAIKNASISNREAEIINSIISQNAFLNIKFFISELHSILKLNRLTIDLFLEKWMSMYGTGTVFGLEVFPNFASILTNTYVGAYIDNQKTIEKITGSHMVDFCKIMLEIGADVV